MTRLSFPFLACAVALAAAATAAAFAQGTQPAPPPPPLPAQLEPLPEIPRPPGIADDADLEPQITIKGKDGEIVEEARVSGRLVWVKVTPRHGRPYFLVPDGTGHVWIRRDSLDTGLKVPLWVLLEF